MQLPRAVRFIGYSLLAVIAIPDFINRARGVSRHGMAWLVFFLLLVAAFELGASAPIGSRAARRRGLSLSLQAAAMVAMCFCAPCRFAAISLVIVASQAALMLSPMATAAGIVAQTAIISFMVLEGCLSLDSIGWLLAMLGFQGAAASAIILARREHSAKAELARTNAELRAARALLEEAARTEERTWIARELHDVLGHNLTALGLELEVAKNVSVGKAREHVVKARDLVHQSLSGVRGVVSAMRSAPCPDVGRAIRALAVDTPGLVVHLEIPEPFVVECSARAHCLVRCVQEILTNTLRHANAQNVWITIERSGKWLTIDAHDDGRGAIDLRAGNGLKGMRARLEEMGGKLVIDTARAFSIRARLPLTRANFDGIDGIENGDDAMSGVAEAVS